MAVEIMGPMISVCSQKCVLYLMTKFLACSCTLRELNRAHKAHLGGSSIFLLVERDCSGIRCLLDPYLFPNSFQETISLLLS